MTTIIMYQPETLFNDTNIFNVSSPYASKGYFFNDRTTESPIVWPSPNQPTTELTEATMPTTNWTEATKPTTIWTEADRPITGYTEVSEPTTNYTEI